MLGEGNNQKSTKNHPSKKNIKHHPPQKIIKNHPSKKSSKIIPPQKSSIFNRLITLQQGRVIHPINPEVFVHTCQRQLQFCCEKRNKIAKNNETKIQESLLLLAYERFQQSQQRQPLVSLPMGFLANLRFFWSTGYDRGPPTQPFP